MRVEEITVGGVAYRGPLLVSSAATPWKITAWRPSRSIGTGGLRVGHSWQTWGRYTSERKCRAALDELKAQAAGGAS